MQRNFGIAVAQTVLLGVLVLAVLFSAAQKNHLEELVIETNRQLGEMSESIDRLKQSVESGAIRVAAAPGSAAATAGAFPGSQYYSAEELEGLMAPGNFLSPPTTSIREGGTEGGTIHRAALSDIPGLNMLTVNAADVSEIYHYVAEPLADRQRDEPERWIPKLAYRIEINDDYTQYHVYLRQGLRWPEPAVDSSDARYAWLNEEHEVVADDFVFYMELALNPQVEAAHLRNYYEKFDRIEVINDHEFIVHWTEATYPSISFTMGMYPMPRWLFGVDEDGRAYDASEVGRQFNSHWYFQTRAYGYGPYRFVDWEQGGAITLERNPDYRGERPLIDSIEYRVMSDGTARLNNLRAGGLDYIPMLQTQYQNAVVEGGVDEFETGDLEYETYQGATYRYLGWNADGQFFGDRRVRLAMTHALNREQLIERNFYGLGRIITGNFFIDGPDYDHSIEPWAFDLHRAAELLTEAGWVDNNGDGVREKMIDGQQVDFEFGMVTYGYRPEFVAAMEQYRNDLRRIGVVMNVEPVEWAVMVQRMNEKDFDAFTGGWQLGWEADPYQIWHSSQADLPESSNRVGFRNAEADAIIEEARATFDPAARSELFNRFHAIVHEEQPYTFFFAPLEIGAWRNRVEDVEFSPLRPFDSNISWWLR